MRPLAMSRVGWQVLYNALLLPLLRLAAWLLAWLPSPRSAKLRDTLAGRRGVFGRLEAALAARDPARPLLWFHVSSAGEFLQALPVLERLAADSAQGGAQIVLTVTSVSGYRWVERLRAAGRGPPGLLALDYLPLDTRGRMRRLLRLLRPAALLYTKYDLWPNLVWEAARAGVPQYLLAATLPARSWRLRSAAARSLYRTLYAALDGIFAVTEADAARFLRTAPGHPGVAVVGDTRFDSVLERRARIAPPSLPPYDGGELGGELDGGPGGAPAAAADAVSAAAADTRRQGTVLVVGSSWPADEQRIVPGLLEALHRHAGLRLLLVPHETDPAHLAALEAAFAAHAPQRFSRLALREPGAPAWRVLLVDTVGQLSALYAYAALAYVGGAFSTGVHNVMEPAAMGVPTLFGPFHQNSPEALHLVSAGLAFSVPDGDAFRRVLEGLLADPPRRAELGARARAWVESQAGAAERSCARIRAGLAARAAAPRSAASHTADSHTAKR